MCFPLSPKMPLMYRKSRSVPCGLFFCFLFLLRPDRRASPASAARARTRDQPRTPCRRRPPPPRRAPCPPPSRALQSRASPSRNERAARRAAQNKEPNTDDFLDIWEKWGRHIWENKRLLGFFLFFSLRSRAHQNRGHDGSVTYVSVTYGEKWRFLM